MPCAGVHQLTGVGVEHSAEGGGAARAGQPGGEMIHGGQRGARLRLLQKQCATSASELPHHSCRGQAMSDTVADDQRDAAVVEVDDVIPVPAHLERTGGRLVANREPGGQIGGAENRVLQRQRRLPLLVQLVHSLQALAEAAGEHREQRVVFRGERSLFGQLDVHVPGYRGDAAVRCPPCPAEPCRG